MSGRRTLITEGNLRAAVAESLSYSEALRKLGLRAAGGNHRTIQKYVRKWRISTEHFDPNAARARASRARARPLEEVLVPNSTYSRGQLKERLYRAGIKRRECEMCGQGELWNGRRMALILDHVNGVATDNRLENLRVVCPNCAATLPTHCGRKIPCERECVHCGRPFVVKHVRQRFCCRGCSVSHTCGGPRPERRKVERPPVERLLAEVEELGYVEVGRRYGVSDNAVRKWLRAEGVEPPRRTWPNRRREADGRRSRVSRPGSARGRARGRAPARRSRPR